MKILAIIIILLALYLLYRLVSSKSSVSTKSNDETFQIELQSDSDIVGKSRFTKTIRSNTTPVIDSTLKTENQVENADIFASETPKNDGIIPTEELDEVFDTSDLDIPPDDEENEINLEEEAEELRQILGHDVERSSGLSYEELQEAIRKPSAEKAEVLCQIEQTDMFEQLILSDEAKANRIKTIIDRYIKQIETELPPDKNNEETDFSNFDIAEYLS